MEEGSLPVSDPWDRYEDLGLLATGGMGEVRKVRDRALGRILVLKRPAEGAGEATRARFTSEARVTARLRHPGIVPLLDAGAGPDGRPWYTMPAVDGRDFRSLLDDGRPASGDTGRGLRRRVALLHRACEALAHAHAQGIVHLDVKPENLLAGPFGEVLVIDWGLALDLRQPGIPRGVWGGTPGYTAPEVQREGPAAAGPAADVWALGSVLHVFLAGRPFDSRAPDGGHEGPGRPAGSAADRDLWRITLMAGRDCPGDRHADAGALAADLQAWLDEEGRREQALALLADARAALGRADEVEHRARRLSQEAARVLRSTPSWTEDDTTRTGWNLEDQANRLGLEGELARVGADRLLQAALQQVPDLPEARSLLADRYRASHEQAERDRDARSCARFESLLRAHDDGRHGRWLDGRGSITLVTDPPGAEVALYRFEEQGRRLRCVPRGYLGTTPLLAVPLDRGSWLLEVRSPGCETLPYPVALGRDDFWDGTPPRARDPMPVRLPRAGELRDGEQHIAGGWTLVGGDAGANESLPRRRVWVPAFNIRTHPVTNGEYIEFLDDILLRRGEPEALRWVPREPASRPGAVGAPLYHRRADGRFDLGSDAHGDTWLPDWPVIHVDWAAAMAYCAWRAERDGLEWRLPRELEWEKAARGVDGRYHPWGDRFHASFCCMRGSHSGRPLPAAVGAFPDDQSPYGVRGMAGNVRDWCLDLYAPPSSAPPVELAAWKGEPARDDGQGRVIRGGSWLSPPPGVRCASRQRSAASQRSETLGFRLARSESGGP